MRSPKPSASNAASALPLAKFKIRGENDIFGPFERKKMLFLWPNKKRMSESESIFNIYIAWIQSHAHCIRRIDSQIKHNANFVPIVLHPAVLVRVGYGKPLKRTAVSLPNNKIKVRVKRTLIHAWVLRLRRSLQYCCFYLRKHRAVARAVALAKHQTKQIIVILVIER